MKIIGKKYRLRQYDDMNIAVEVLGPERVQDPVTKEVIETGQIVAKKASFFPGIRPALSWLFDRATAEAFEEAEDLKALLIKVDEIKAELQQAVFEFKRVQALSGTSEDEMDEDGTSALPGHENAGNSTEGDE